MTITVLLFASLRESLGTDRLELDVPDGATAREVFGLTHVSMDPAHLRVAVNHQFVDWSHVMRSGDTLSLIPPVAGG